MGKYIRIIQYLFLAPLIILLLNWARDINKGGFKFEAQRALKIDGTPLKVF